MRAMDIRQAIRVEQGRLIHRNIPTAVVGGFLVASLTVAVFSQVTPLRSLLPWLLVAALLSAYRMWSWIKYRGRIASFEDANRWLRAASRASPSSGI